MLTMTTGGQGKHISGGRPPGRFFRKAMLSNDPIWGGMSYRGAFVYVKVTILMNRHFSGTCRVYKEKYFILN